jgi:deoxyribonucleoside regulator
LAKIIPNYENRIELLAHVASLYYDQNKTQQEISGIVGVTRSAISRLLNEAREKGVVEINVHYPWRTNPDLEKTLKNIFNLKEVRVLVRGDKDYHQMIQGLGVLAAQYFSSILTPRSIVGISWGTNLYETIQAIKRVSLPEVEVVQLVGGTGTEKGSVIGPLLAPMLANRLNCKCRFINAPLVTKSAELRNAFISDPTIKEAIDRANYADIALVGIGSLHLDIYNPFRLGYLTSDEVEGMKDLGIVGDVCCQHFCIDGSIPEHEINDRMVGISAQTLRNIKTKIGVAGDTRKAEAIFGAIQGQLINVLITDESAARIILGLYSEKQGAEVL